VFVIERADELGEEAANRMLKTLEEPAAFVHIILLTDRLGEILPTIRSRCQAVRFEAPSEERAAGELQELGLTAAGALACVRLALQDADRARELAAAEGQGLRRAAERYARTALVRQMGREKPWNELLAAVRSRGDAAEAELEALKQAELELTSKKDKKRVETEWSERIRRTRRRVQTGALDLALQVVALWFADLTFIGLGASELVRNGDREAEIAQDAGQAPPPHRLRAAIELVEDTRQRFALNVSEDLACEALAYRLEQALAA
jgi:DNA polymerase-3 subunit delta'